MKQDEMSEDSRSMSLVQRTDLIGGPGTFLHFSLFLMMSFPAHRTPMGTHLVFERLSENL